MLVGMLAGLGGAIVGYSLFALLGKITWDRALDMFGAYLVGAVIIGLFLLMGARITKNKDKKEEE